jgi:hypothetical protein
MREEERSRNKRGGVKMLTELQLVQSASGSNNNMKFEHAKRDYNATITRSTPVGGGCNVLYSGFFFEKRSKKGMRLTSRNIHAQCPSSSETITG